LFLSAKDFQKDANFGHFLSYFVVSMKNRDIRSIIVLGFPSILDFILFIFFTVGNWPTCFSQRFRGKTGS